MSLMPKVQRGARAATAPDKRRLACEAGRSVTLARRAKLLMVSAAVAVASLAAALATAGPAFANSIPSIIAEGGPGNIWVTGTGFTPPPLGGTRTVTVEALTYPGLEAVGYPQNTQVDSSGDISVDLPVGKFTGPVYVAADQLGPYIGTAWARTDVTPPPQFSLNGTHETTYNGENGTNSCGLVSVELTGFARFSPVRVELLDDGLTTTLNNGNAENVNSDFVGDVSLSSSPSAAGPALSTQIPMSGGKCYTGWAWIVADEHGAPPNFATAWYHLYVS